MGDIAARTGATGTTFTRVGLCQLRSNFLFTSLMLHALLSMAACAACHPTPGEDRFSLRYPSVLPAAQRLLAFVVAAVPSSYETQVTGSGEFGVSLNTRPPCLQIHLSQ